MLVNILRNTDWGVAWKYGFRFLAGELSIQDFEQWIYATSELEEFLDKDAYYSLLSFDFRLPRISHEVSKFIYENIDTGRFHTWNIKRLLNILLNDSQDAVEVFEKLYSMYWNRYDFLHEITIQYAAGIDDIPKLKEKDFWEEKAFAVRRNALNEFVRTLLPSIEIILQGLESEKIKIIDEQKYLIDPELAKQLEEKIIGKPLYFGPNPSMNK